MKAKRNQRFDLDVLRDLAGPRAFARGQAYHQEDHVAILSIEPRRVIARVAGTEDYRTELTGRGEEIDGNCSCPAFEDAGFCKHMVAVALAANALGDSAKMEDAGVQARMRQYLKAKGLDSLVAMIIELAEHDPSLFHKLDVAATIARSDDDTIEARLQKAIDNATGTKRFVEYREAPGWAARVDEVLDTIADLASSGRPSLGLKLAERAIDRIEKAVENMDDSDGHCGALLARAGEIHLAAALAARPEPVQLACNLFARETKSEHDTFFAAAAHYADVLGETGLAEYRRLATEAWRELAPPKNGSTPHEISYDRDRLREILDFFAEREGSVEERIALRAQDLSSPWRYLELANFCLSQGRVQEALQRAEEGLWIFEDGRPDERLVFFAVDLLTKAGRNDDAQAHLWRAFEKAPSLELYKRLSKLGGKLVRERALGFLEEAQAASGKRTSWHFPTDLLATILTREKMFDRAWIAVSKHGASAVVKQTLARASESSHPREALEVYSTRVEHLVNSGGNPAYTEAAQLVARMAGLRSVSEQTAYVVGLKDRFHRRRNFLKLLN